MPAEDVTISVTYDELYDILVSSTHGIVTITGNKTQAVESESIEFTITPNSDYRIIEVKVNNDTLTESDGKYTFKMPAGDATISVKYAEEYAITIDTSVSDMVSGVSLDKAISGQQVVVTANIQDTVTDDYVVMSDGLYYIENGSEEKVTINQTGGQYSFTMPANDITIGVEKYRRLDDFTFSGNAITGYTGSATELTLPSHYETVSINSQDYIVEKNTGTQITSIGRYAFASCSNLQTVDFGDNSQLQTIDSYAFSSCRDLTSITIPESVTKIGSSAFYGTNLNDIYYQGTLDQWSDISFANTDWSNCNLYIDDTLVEEITINKNIKTRAFYGITSIKKVTLGENVTSIGYSAFEGCYSLAIVYNNSSLNITTGSSSNGNVGDYAYEVVNAGEEAKGRIEKIDNVSYYINGTTKVALSMIDRSATTVSLEEDTTVINQRAFQNCTNLTSITIPASVTSIGKIAQISHQSQFLKV